MSLASLCNYYPFHLSDIKKLSQRFALQELLKQFLVA